MLKNYLIKNECLREFNPVLLTKAKMFSVIKKMQIIWSHHHPVCLEWHEETEQTETE